MKRMFLIIALAITPLFFSACHVFAGSAAEMCRERMQEKHTCRNLFFVTYDQCDGEAICEENAMALNFGCMSIPTDSCGKGDGKGGGGGK